MEFEQLSVGQTTLREGCFTFENYIMGQTVPDIGRRLGLPHIRLTHGIFIAYPESKPDMQDFELAGVTFDSTNSFVDYENRQSKYNAQKFQSKELYSKNAVIPVDFDDIKRQYQKVFSPEGLVKVIPKVKHFTGLDYPAGGLTPQFLAVRNLTWIVKYFIPMEGVFQK